MISEWVSVSDCRGGGGFLGVVGMGRVWMGGYWIGVDGWFRLGWVRWRVGRCCLSKSPTVSTEVNT